MTNGRHSLADSPFGEILRSLCHALPEEFRPSVRLIQWLMLQSGTFPFRPVACTVLPISRHGSPVARAQLLTVAESLASDTSLAQLNMRLAEKRHPFRLLVGRNQAYVDGLFQERFRDAFTLWFSNPREPRDHVTILTLPSEDELWRLTAHLYPPRIGR